MEYLDFDLEIGEGNGLSYPVAVRSPGGEARETMNFPYNRDRMELRLKDLTIALLRSASISRLNLPPELQSVKEMGADFFNAILTGEIRSRYDLSRRMAEEQNKGLRIRLRIQAPELSALPWEYLYDPRNCEYVCLSASTPLVRYLEVPQVIRPLAVDLPLRILGMVCSPSSLRPLDVDQEKKRVEDALADLQKRGLVELTWLPGQTWSDLQEALYEGPWHIFHFIGHGDFNVDRDEGYLCLTGADGKSHPLHATELARLLGDHRELRVVVLNACQGARSSWGSIFSSTAAVLVRRGIACAVAMQFSITDSAAVELSSRFYHALLARKLPVDLALTEARKALSIGFADSVEWGTPVLFMRSPDGVLFHHKAAAKPAPKPQEEPLSGQSKVDTAGGAYVEGSVNTGGGAFVGKDQTVIHVHEGGTVNIQPEKPASRQGSAQPTPEALSVPESVKGRAQREGDRMWVQLAPNVEMEFVRVPAGNFWMGSDPQVDKYAREDEQPRRQVWLDEYWIGRYPVTWSQYAAFLKATGAENQDWENGVFPPGKEAHPAVWVTWEDAAAFCKWSSLDLPSEAQWENSARGTDGRIYPWGNEKPDRERCNIDSWYQGTTPVGKFSPKGDSIYGCGDMVGNVWEWCADWYGEKYYSVSPDHNPLGPEKGRYRILRGGSWGFDRDGPRCASRSRLAPDDGNLNFGFRCVLSR